MKDEVSELLRDLGVPDSHQNRKELAPLVVLLRINNTLHLLTEEIRNIRQRME